MECLECKKNVKRLNKQHLDSCCGLTLDEYKNKHPNSLIMDEDVRKSFGRPLDKNNNWRGGKTYRNCKCGKRVSRNNKTGLCKSCIKRQYNDEIKEHIIELVKNGKAGNIIAEELNIPKTVLYRIIKKSGVKNELLQKNNSKIFIISARDVWKEYTGGKEYYTWMKTRIKKYKLKENIDYIYIQKNKLSAKGAFVSNYYLKDDVAKKIKEGDKHIKKQSKANILYFIYSEMNNSIKIGVTNDIKLRLKTLQNMSPVKLNLIKSVNINDAKNLAVQIEEENSTSDFWGGVSLLLAFILLPINIILAKKMESLL